MIIVGLRTIFGIGGVWMGAILPVFAHKTARKYWSLVLHIGRLDNIFTYLVVKGSFPGRKKSFSIPRLPYSSTIWNRMGAASLNTNLIFSENSPASATFGNSAVMSPAEARSSVDPIPRIYSTARTVRTKSFWTIVQDQNRGNGER